MQATIGQCVALITFANAVLQGEEVTLDWKNNPWFARVAEYRFGVGEPGGPTLADDPNEWFDYQRRNGFRAALLHVEPFNGMWDTIHHVGFAGGLQMAPITVDAHDAEIIWHERPQFDRERQAWLLYRGGFSMMPGRNRVHATKDEAGKALDAALEKILAFQQRYRAGEHHFSEMFHRGRRQLQSAGFAPRTLMEMSNEDEVREKVRPLFPVKFDPKALALVAAVEASWALGGMGWWADWSTQDDGANMLFRQSTFAYYEAMTTCLAAACEPAL